LGRLQQWLVGQQWYIGRAVGQHIYVLGLVGLTFFSSVRKKGGDEEAFFLLTHHDDVFSSFSLM
jgi:hypothetical protein